MDWCEPCEWPCLERVVSRVRAETAEENRRDAAEREKRQAAAAAAAAAAKEERERDREHSWSSGGAPPEAPEAKRARSSEASHWQSPAL